MKTKDLFDLSNSSKIEINNGEIKCIWLEGSNQTKLDNENCATLETGQWALIELEIGKKILITNSEWASINLIDVTQI